jgi:hypothetical protein
LKQQYIPLEKRSKREQKAHFAARRGNWGDVNPVTRKSPNPKVYNRKKSDRRYYEPPVGFFLYISAPSVSLVRRIFKRIPLTIFQRSVSYNESKEENKSKADCRRRWG